MPNTHIEKHEMASRLLSEIIRQAKQKLAEYDLLDKKVLSAVSIPSTVKSA